MNMVKEWSALLCITVVICALAEFLIPPGKTEKIINMVLGTFVLCTFIMPLREIKNNFNTSFKNIFSSPPLSPSKDVTDNLNKQVSDTFHKNTETIIKRHLNNLNINFEKVEVLMDINKDNCIVMIMCKVYIPKIAENSKEFIKTSVEKNLNIKTEVIVC